MSCSSSLWEMGAGARGLGPGLVLAREDGLEPEALAGARGRRGAESLKCCSDSPSLIKKESLRFLSRIAGALAGEFARMAGRTVCLFRVISLDSPAVQSSKGVPRSSSRSSSIPPLMKPESGSVARCGRFGLERVGIAPSRTGGEEGMLNEGSNRPWYRGSSGECAF